MKKFLTIIVIITLSISIVRILQTFFTTYFYYDYAIWCGEEDKDYIKSKTGINTAFSIAVCKVSWNREDAQSKIMKGFPSVFGKNITIKKGNYAISEYIKDNDAKVEVMLKSSIPYIIICLLDIIVFYTFLLPKYNNE